MDQIASDLEWLRHNALAHEEDVAEASLRSATTHADSPSEGGATSTTTTTARPPENEDDNDESVEGGAVNGLGDAHAGAAALTFTAVPLPPLKAAAASPPSLSSSAPQQPPLLTDSLTPAVEAAMRAMRADLLAAQEAETHAQEALQQARTQLAESRREVEPHRASADRLARQVALYAADLQVVEEQTESLGATVQALHAEVRKAWHETERLLARLDTAEEERAQYERLKATHATTLAELAALNAQRADMAKAHEELQQLVQTGRQVIDEGVAYWTACREEQQALRDALAHSEAVNRAWEACSPSPQSSFSPVEMADATNQAPGNDICAPVAVAAETVNEEEQQSDEMSHEPSDVPADTSSFSCSLLATLETKVVDLALNLQLVTQRAAVQSAQHDHLAALAVLQTSALTSAEAQLALVRPTAAALARQTTVLQADCAAAEAAHASLLAAYQALLEDYTEDALHTHAMERRLAELVVCRSGRGGATAGTGVSVVSVPMRFAARPATATATPAPAPGVVPPAPQMKPSRPNLADLFQSNRKRPHS